MKRLIFLAGLAVLILIVPFEGKAADIEAKLNDAAGASAFSVKDSGSAEAGHIDSDGNTVIRGGLRLDSSGAECTTAENLIVDGNVGIGTTGPSEKLMVAGNVAPSADSAYNLGASSYYWANTYTDKLYLNPTATLDGATAGEITQIGNIIPSVNDTYTLGKSSYLYDAVYTNRIYGAYGTLKSRTTGWESSTHFYPLYDSSSNLGASSYYWANTYTDKLYLNPTATLDGATAGAISITGNVGIGTTGPGAKLDVLGSIRVQSAEPTFNMLLVPERTATDRRLTFENSSSMTTGGWDFFASNAAFNTSVMRIQNNGNVGIGTTNPGAKLDVVGSVYVHSGTLYADSIAGYTSATITLGGSTAGYPFTLTTSNNNHLILSPNGTGNVGIGTTSPSYILDVQHASLKVNSKNGYLTNGADYAEYFENEEAILQGSLVGMDLATGKARKYRQGDEFLGIVSNGKGFIGNGDKTIENNPKYTIVGLLGQLEVNQNEVTIEGRIVYTKDRKKIGILLSNGKVLVR